MVCAVQDARTMKCEKKRHGKTIDAKGWKVSCNYCGKVVSGYNRLEHHLAGIRGNVCPCNLVPDSVRASLRSSLVDRKKDWMLRKTGKLKDTEVPLIKNPSLPSAQVHQPHLQPSMSCYRCFLQCPPNLMQPMETTQVNTNDVSYSSSSYQQGGQTLEATCPQYQNPCPMNKQSGISSVLGINSCSGSMDISSSSQMQQSKPKEANDYLDPLIAKSIGKLIFEVGLEPCVLQLSSFEGIVDLLAHGAEVAMPTYESILQDQLRETEHRARELKQQWGISGCSVILDSWKGQCGKSFISILVHCSKGMLFLRSMDVSAIIDDVDELASMLSRVVDDVGAHNIVQIVTNDVSPYMQAAEHAVLKKHDHSLFFTLCADHCINLLLEKIAAFDHVSEVLMKAREITRFIYSHALPMELKGGYIQEEILSSSYLKFVAVFITLERLVSERVNLVEMFSSPEWASSGWASKSLFRHICGILKTDDAFWCAAADVLKVTNPLVSVLYKLESDNCPMGILYDVMDVAKEDIKHNLGDKHDDYWRLVDKIWDNYLHTPLHAAGYVLNPRIFYTDRFRHDTETSSGITACIIQLAKGHYNPRKVAVQMEVYQKKSGSVDSGSAIQKIMETPQVLWWSAHGAGTPDLQTFAVRILSQTCFGASRYNIDRRLSEQLHIVPRTYSEQEKFRKMEYVHYNLRFARAAPCLRGPSGVQHGQHTTQLDDWIEAPRQLQ